MQCDDEYLPAKPPNAKLSDFGSTGFNATISSFFISAPISESMDVTEPEVGATDGKRKRVSGFAEIWNTHLLFNYGNGNVERRRN